YKSNIISDLPRGADQSSAWRLSNLLKAQVNLTETNILSASFLANDLHANHIGLSRFNPLETTPSQKDSAYLLTLKDQVYFSSGMLLEIGMGLVRFDLKERPLGNLPYMILPEGAGGNYFRTTDGSTRRLQGIANVIFPGFKWKGRHEIKAGVDIDEIAYERFFARRPILIVNEAGVLARRINFLGSPPFTRENFEVSGY